MTVVARLLLFLLLAASAARAEELGPLTTILEGTPLLVQCSRSAPETGEGRWRPTLADIERLEAQLPRVLDGSDLPGRPTAAAVSTGWIRQYVGVVRNGRRYLYGSFFPASAFRNDTEWRNWPVIICDGGPSIFGVEMDADSHAITHYSANGRL